MPAKKKRQPKVKAPVKAPIIEPALDESPPTPPAVERASPIESVSPEKPSESEPAVPFEEAADAELEKAVLSDNPQESQLDTHNRTLYWVSVAVAVGIVAVSLIVGSAAVGMPQKQERREKKPAIARVSTPTLTPVAVRRSDITLEVYNASGVSGAAGKMGIQLIEAGYTVIGTGNAPKQKTTEVYMAHTVSDAAKTMLLADLTTIIGVGSSSGALSESTASARIVLGSE